MSRDWTCILCGHPVSKASDAFFADDDDAAVWHLDCADRGGSNFGDDGMPTTWTEGMCEIQRRGLS